TLPYGFAIWERLKEILPFFSSTANLWSFSTTICNALLLFARLLVFFVAFIYCNFNVCGTLRGVTSVETERTLFSNATHRCLIVLKMCRMVFDGCNDANIQINF